MIPFSIESPDAIDEVELRTSGATVTSFRASRGSCRRRNAFLRRRVLLGLVEEAEFAVELLFGGLVDEFWRRLDDTLAFNNGVLSFASTSSPPV